MESNWKGARKESQQWTEGIGFAVTDKNAFKRIGKKGFKEAHDWTTGIGSAVLDKGASKRIGKYSNRASKEFIGSMKKSMKGLK